MTQETTTTVITTSTTDSKLDYNSNIFNTYNKLNAHEPHIPHSLNINLSKIFFKSTFQPDFYITYAYDIKSSFNFVYIPHYLPKKYKIVYNITRDHTQLKFFDPNNDFEFAPIPNAADNSKYIKKIINPHIRKISTQQYILKNLSRWIITDPEDSSKIRGVYKTKLEIPDELKNQAIEIIAKPKIMIRIFKHTKNNNLLIQFTRYFYNVDTLQFINYKSKFEFTRYSLPVYVEIAPKE